MKRKIAREAARIAKSLEGSRVDLPAALKLRTAEAILEVMVRRKRHFGMFVILGWRDAWRKHLDIADSAQDIFAKDRHSILEDASGRHRGHDIASTVDFDGAILIDRKGTIVHSGVIIEGLRPRVIADKVNPGRFKDLSEQFGFLSKVHARHLAAIAASYVFKGTTVFTVSEENDAFHVFEEGRIVHRRRTPLA
jgi:hypothetical protein